MTRVSTLHEGSVILNVLEFSSTRPLRLSKGLLYLTILGLLARPR